MNKITISDLDYMVTEKALNNKIKGGAIKPYAKGKGQCSGGKCKGEIIFGIKIRF